MVDTSKNIFRFAGRHIYRQTYFQADIFRGGRMKRKGIIIYQPVNLKLLQEDTVTGAHFVTVGHILQ